MRLAIANEHLRTVFYSLKILHAWTAKGVWNLSHQVQLGYFHSKQDVTAVENGLRYVGVGISNMTSLLHSLSASGLPAYRDMDYGHLNGISHRNATDSK